MTRKFQLRPAGAAITLVIALSCGDLLLAWRNSPYDRLGWLAFAIWLGGGAALAWEERERIQMHAGWFFIALVVAWLGFMAEVNALQHVGLALALAGFGAGGVGRWLWLCGAASWTPALGWISARWVGPEAMMVLRLALAAAGVGVSWGLRRRRA